jgi:protein-tyrosine phosphatase
MATKLINLDDTEVYRDAIAEAVAVLDGGGLVVFPTETVYGVAARADRAEGLKRLHRVKDRPADRPFTIHIGRRSDAERFVPDLSPLARRLAKKAWPGPLTMVLSTSDARCADIASQLEESVLDAMYHNGAVGLRCPDDHAALDLLRGAGGPVVAASANRAGRTPPGTVKEALAELNGEVELALDGGPSRYNRPSTIVRVDGDRFDVLRSGVYDERMLRGFAVLDILFVCSGNTCRSPMARAIAMRLIADRLGCKPEELGDRKIEIHSAGTSAGRGAPVSQPAVAVAAEHGIDIGRETSQPLSAELVNRADYIFTMTDSHRTQVIETVPSAADRTQRLMEEKDIPDPIGGDQEVYARCAKDLETSIKTRLSEIDL